MENTEIPDRVSVHGGHSGEFCSHAKDTLEAVIETYIRNGFRWVGITEHMPPVSDRFLYSEEIAAGLDAAGTRARFERYIRTCRELQKRHDADIRIYAAMETEAYAGALDYAERIIEEFQPDYWVGSVHHVRDMPFDGSPVQYREAADAVGGIDALYCAYFDRQHEMIRRLKPAVVGHFDLIRIFDDDYPARLENPEIADRIARNLDVIQALDLILDFNVRALAKGAREPYVSSPILRMAIDRGIALVPGDDSHGVATVGQHLDEGIAILKAMGADTRWRRPRASAAAPDNP